MELRYTNHFLHQFVAMCHPIHLLAHCHMYQDIK
nr:MAG TPA: hypothetical protein [Caudoviricetes sp.]